MTGGLDLADYQQRIANYFSDVMVNALPPEIHILKYQNEDLIAVIVKPILPERKPCFNKELGLPNGACIRVGNTNRVISFEEMSQFIRGSATYRFDRTTAPGVVFGDLSLKKIAGFFEKTAARVGRKTTGLGEQDFINAGIAVFEGRNLVPTVGGYLIFSELNPLQSADFTRFQIRCVRYSGTSPSSPIVDKADISGTLDEQIEATQAFILKSIPLSASIVGSRRIEEYAYPADAIREVVANAVIHRDYQTRETYTQVAIFSDHLEVSNPGNLPPGITVKNLMVAQFSRNEVIAQILRDMSYMEEYGRGIDLIYSRMREKGLLSPIFRNVANSFKVTLLGPRFSSMNQRQIDVWQLLQQESKTRITASEYEKMFDVSRPSVNGDLAQMVDLGLLRKEGGGPNTFYEANF